MNFQISYVQKAEVRFKPFATQRYCKELKIGKQYFKNIDFFTPVFSLSFGCQIIAMTLSKKNIEKIQLVLGAKSGDFEVFFLHMSFTAFF